MIYTHILPNGIRVIHRKCSGDVSCCGLVVNAGTRHELENELGIAHFTEHMLFKGTGKRSPHNILNRMERVGGELNAYTTKEETFVYSIFLKKDYQRAIELLGNLFFDSVFNNDEIEKERDVIFDEINSYEDSPSELIFDDFDQHLFPGHPLGRKILGETECLKNFDSESFKNFHLRNYSADKIVFFSQSPVSFDKVKYFAEKHLTNYYIPTSRKEMVNFKPEVSFGKRETIIKDTHQAHVIIGNENFSFFEEKDRMVMYFLNNILGGPGMNSRLNIALREKSGLVYNVESNVVSYTDSGVFTIYFGSDIDKVDVCISKVEKELKKFREIQLTKSQIDSAKKQLYGQINISAENKENQTLSMGKSMLYFNKYDSMSELTAKIDSITPSDIVEVARKVFNPDAISVLIYK